MIVVLLVGGLVALAVYGVHGSFAVFCAAMFVLSLAPVGIGVIIDAVRDRR